MARYRKKPVIIEAVQFNTMDDIQDICDFVGKILMCASNLEGEIIIIPTLEGDMKANLGDWIIKGVQGECYPCKPDIFEATYEFVGD